MKSIAVILLMILTNLSFADNAIEEDKLLYPIVHTGVTQYYDAYSIIPRPHENNAFLKQDAEYQNNKPSYTDNQDGTISDNITGLMWQKDMGEKMTLKEAEQSAKDINLGEFKDWRIPTIKELYSLIDFNGRVQGEKSIKPFINTKYFIQPLGDSGKGERQIDAQTWSSTKYTGLTMNRNSTIFGVNFLDGRIKGYPEKDPKTGKAKKMYFRMVRRNTEYGKNKFRDNGDGTISDLNTGLMWTKNDSKYGMQWSDALLYAKRSKVGGYSDWRLPNAKELQSIVDYSRSPQKTKSPAINPIFITSKIGSRTKAPGYPYFWTSTTHKDGPDIYRNAVYIAFGEAIGRMHDRIMDVHGAGAQRSDPKFGRKKDYPKFFGPQGDERRVFNYVRLVRNIKQQKD